jgi:glucose/arabinose dehydrogenase
MPKFTLTLAALLALAVGAGNAAEKTASSTNVLVGKAAFGDWRDDAPGVRRLIKASDMPAPNETQSARNSPATSEMPQGAKPKVPEGFSVEMVASGLEQPRVVRVAPNGDLFVADSKANAIRVFRLKVGSAEPEEDSVFADGLNKPYGIAFYPPGDSPEWVYVANTDSVVRFPYEAGDLKATGKPETIVDKIIWTHHWTRDVVFSRDGKKMFVSVGSGSNIALDMSHEPFEGMEEFNKTHPLGATWDTEEDRANVLVFTPEGKNKEIYATGLRNCSGMTIAPESGELWCVVNERDELGDDLPFEYATHVEKGKFYGWPWFYIGGNEDPRHKGKRPELADEVTVPDILMQAHSAPLGIVFNENDALGADYKGDAFVTLHGSWNRGHRTGYKVVRLIFENGKPTGEYEDFMTGFVISDEEVWGRPVGAAVAEDGALIVTEDGSGTIWRVSRQKPAAS